ncbi:hypothetical protein ACFO5K_12770 [Nocardia halotolerans]|uniref:Uncharacterized protein n=1 Tax=Nocardia halotolerans TaxID=1755878 RepID=A0ABV8VJF4_9NOCA
MGAAARSPGGVVRREGGGVVADLGIELGAVEEVAGADADVVDADHVNAVADVIGRGGEAFDAGLGALWPTKIPTPLMPITPPVAAQARA